jgi:metal-responsive CopG/Arc/MetJ family transcriptional regulator
MSNSESEMKLLCVRVHRELYNTLRRIAFRKYNTLHGAIARAVREALQEYIDKHGAEEKEIAQITQA